MTSPYRESAQLLLCPRCGELLDTVLSGVAACPRCQGAWIAQPTLDTAFGDPRWPPGHTMWWHDELDCPECLVSGVVQTMSARGSGDVRVDACPSHGLWLDRGELIRLLGLAAGSDELLELQRRVTSGVPDSEDIMQRRRMWESDRDSRRRAAIALRAELEALQKRHAEELAEEEQRDRAEAVPGPALEATVPGAPPAVEVDAANAQAAADLLAARARIATEVEARATSAALIRSYRDERARVRDRLVDLRTALATTRTDLKLMEADLVRQRTSLAAKQESVVKLSQEIEGLDARLSVLERHLQGHRP